MADFAPGSTGTDEVLFARAGALGRVLLNRPRAINSLTSDMVEAMRTQLTAWADDEAITAVALEGAGERGFCAGGDVRAVREAHLAGGTGGLDFWAHEYVLDAQLAEYPKPVIGVMDGIVMGGGLGLTMFGAARWTTERSRIAMPETIIGFFPDVAATYLLSRAPGEAGTHVALTGTTITGADAVHLGLADAVVDSSSVSGLLAAIAAGARSRPCLTGRPPPRGHSSRPPGRGSTSAMSVTTRSSSSSGYGSTPTRPPGQLRPRSRSARRCPWR